MTKLTPEEEKQKKYIYDTMSKRNKKKVDEIGYDDWDPFLKPKDPADMRLYREKQSATMLTKNFLSTIDHKGYSNEYGQGVFEMCMGIIGKEDKYKGMYEFSCWYKEQMDKQKDE